MAIDPSLQKSNFRPDNAYRFIERKVSICPSSNVMTPMTYSTHDIHKNELKSLHVMDDEQADQMYKLTMDFNSMKQKPNKN